MLAAFTVYVILAPTSAFPSAQEQSSSRIHVVTPDQLTTDLLQHHQEREANLAKIGALIERPEARQTLALMGADWTEVEERIATLSAAELGDIGNRIDEISGQHAGGMHPAVIVALIAIAAVIIFIIIALATWNPVEGVRIFP